jgi:iron-sulfur cluster assembly accessory protein
VAMKAGMMNDSARQLTDTGEACQDSCGFEVVIDRMSLPYLAGATIDYADTLQRQGFVIDNPNAAGSCACGDSFH